MIFDKFLNTLFEDEPAMKIKSGSSTTGNPNPKILHGFRSALDSLCCHQGSVTFHSRVSSQKFKSFHILLNFVLNLAVLDECIAVFESYFS